MFSQLLIYLFVTFIFFTSISGYGYLSLRILNINKKFSFNNTIAYILGLNLIGVLSIITNFFTELSDIISIMFIILGIIAFLLSVFFNLIKLGKKTFYLLFIVTIAVFFSYYTRLNDDFNYHYLTIYNYKTLSLFEINHQIRTSYNSIWLLIHSMFYLKFYNESLFIITSLLYSLTLFDSYSSFKRNKKNNNYLPMMVSFFLLIFLIGVLNSHKEYGTDFPGQIILAIIIIIFFENYLKTKEVNNNIFILLFMLSYFCVLIKLSNVYVFILIFIIFLMNNRKFITLMKCILLSVPVFLWFCQNLIISGCLAWPLYFTCLKNKKQAFEELVNIERFAKGDMDLLFDVDYINNFNWFLNWLNVHSIKILETYGLYVFIFFVPFLVLLLNSKLNKNEIKFVNTSKNFLNLNKVQYLVFFFLTLIGFILWFLKTPAHRFAIINNLNLFILLLLPLWFYIYECNKSFFKKTTNVIIILSICFFLEKNISKYGKYYERHGPDWPPILSKEV